jgi:hypothetical protein
MVNVINKKCRCGKIPTYNEPNETVAICCATCKTDTMVDIKHKKCRCGKIPNYNEPNETVAICCATCKTDTMVDVISKKCRCGKIPNYNEPNETVAICCATCKTDTMINVISKKCRCGKAQPNYNEPNETVAICCATCKTDTMVDVKNKKCRCGKIPTYNEPNETVAICCATCKTDTMVDVKNKKCRCGKRPNYNEPNETVAICCATCKTDTMVDVKNKKCRCGKARPSYNEPNETVAICCATCKTDTMVDVIKKCLGYIINGITTDCPYNTRGNPKYKNYCTECFRRNFPLDPMTFQIRSKTKEIAVRDFINANYDGFQHDKHLDTNHCDCSVRRRIDHRKLFGNTLLAIDTDENQHKPYDKMDEETRYDDLYMAFSGKWIYIRFNPDKYRNKKGETKNPMIATRLEVLKNEIDKQIRRIECEENTEPIERIYLYYDNYD